MQHVLAVCQNGKGKQQGMLQVCTVGQLTSERSANCSNGDAAWRWLLEVIMQHGDTYCAGFMAVEVVLLVSVGTHQESKDNKD
jgi:hypothetical protein